MIDPSQVAVVIPTRGNVPMGQIIIQYGGFAPSYVWDNSAAEDLGVYGRYAAIEKTDAPVIITQDDDVILPRETIQALLAAYEPGKVVCNIPQRFRTRYKDSGMVGFGAIFDRDLPRQSFNRFYSAQRAFEDIGQGKTWVFSVADRMEPVSEETIQRTCDLVFTMLTPMIQVDLPYVELAYGKYETRMWRQPGHFDERDRMRKLCREVRDGEQGPPEANEMLVCIDCGRYAEECEPELVSIGGTFLTTGAWVCPLCRCKRDMRQSKNG